MAVVIEELEVDASESRGKPPPAEKPEQATPAALDERAVRELLARTAWREERLAAD